MSPVPTPTRHGWRSVPMPAQIARLPRDPERGYPIPYIAQRYPLVMPPPFEYPLGAVATEDTTGEVELDLGHMSESRQRRCWLEGVCQVCERRIKPGGRWLAGGVGDRPLENFGFREPYVCGSCMGYALSVCPGLLIGVRRGDLRVVHVRRVELGVERLVIGPTGAGVARVYPITESVPQSVAMYLRGKVTDGDVMEPADYLARWSA